VNFSQHNVRDALHERSTLPGSPGLQDRTPRPVRILSSGAAEFVWTLPSRIHSLAILCILTICGLLIHGYHPYAEDAAIYVPGIKKILHPALYPFGSEFFLSHARMTQFDEFAAGFIRAMHAGAETGLFILYVLSIFLLLSACWSLSRHLFADDVDCWTGVALIAALLTIPAAGTSLLLADPYLTPRSFSTPAVLFALSATLGRRYTTAAAWLLIAAAFHPLMVVFGVALCGSVTLLQRDAPRRIWGWVSNKYRSEHAGRLPMLLVPAGLPLLFLGLTPASEAYLAALHTRGYFFVTNWAWYEWIGVAAPLSILVFIARFPSKRSLESLRHICWASVLCGLLFTAMTLILTSSPRFESIVEVQPMRIFHPLYILFFLVLGATIRDIAGRKAIRYFLVFAPICITMFLVQRATFPGNRHLELPGLKPANRWLESFAWIRENTPETAIFALNPTYMHMPGEDNQGFRAVAERSMLVDSSKDTGVVTMFPALAATWQQEIAAQQGWEKFQLADFERLSRDYGVSWVVLDTPDKKGLECPYERESILVCRIVPAADHRSVEAVD